VRVGVMLQLIVQSRTPNVATIFEHQTLNFWVFIAPHLTSALSEARPPE